MGSALLELREWCISHPSTQRTNAGSVHRVAAWESGVSKVAWIVQRALRKVSSPAKVSVHCRGAGFGPQNYTCSKQPLFFIFLWLGLPVFQEFLFCARIYSWLCAVHPSRAKWSTLSDLAPRGGRSTWNWDSMGEGGTCLVPSIAISSSLLCLAGCLFTTVWQEAVSLCQLISHFSINIV